MSDKWQTVALNGVLKRAQFRPVRSFGSTDSVLGLMGEATKATTQGFAARR